MMESITNCLIFICKDDRQSDYNVLDKLIMKGDNIQSFCDPYDYDREFAKKSNFNDLCVCIIHLTHLSVDLQIEAGSKLKLLLAKLLDILPLIGIPSNIDTVICGHFSIPFSEVSEEFKRIGSDNDKIMYFANAMDGIDNMVMHSYTRGGRWASNADRLLNKLRDDMLPKKIGKEFRRYHEFKMHECRALPIKQDINLLRVYLFARSISNEDIKGIDPVKCSDDILKRLDYIPDLRCYKKTFEDLKQAILFDNESLNAYDECFTNIEKYIYSL